MAAGEAGPSPAAASAEARSRGNAAFTEGDLAGAVKLWTEALELWRIALDNEVQPAMLEVGQLVQYSDKGYFGTVMSVFPLFDEYFLKDMGSDQAIWAGEAGGKLRRFERRELRPLTRELVDLLFAVLQNLAAACLKQEAWEQSVRWADQALCIEGRAPKALMRKGAALLRLNRPGPASDCLATAAEEVPEDKQVLRLLRDAEKRRSPFWVCAAGCCGPWGIVCGGPVSDTMAQVVPPAVRRPELATSGDAALVAGDASPEGGGQVGSATRARASADSKLGAKLETKPADGEAEAPGGAQTDDTATDVRPNAREKDSLFPRTAECGNPACPTKSFRAPTSAREDDDLPASPGQGTPRAGRWEAERADARPEPRPRQQAPKAEARDEASAAKSRRGLGLWMTAAAVALLAMTTGWVFGERGVALFAVV